MIGPYACDCSFRTEIATLDERSALLMVPQLWKEELYNCMAAKPVTLRRQAVCGTAPEYFSILQYAYNFLLANNVSCCEWPWVLPQLHLLLGDILLSPAWKPNVCPSHGWLSSRTCSHPRKQWQTMPQQTSTISHNDTPRWRSLVAYRSTSQDHSGR